MKYLAILAAAASLLLGGCATTIRSDVTAFNNWPASLPDKAYAFVAPAPAEDTLEYRSYQGLVGNELAKLGFHVADNAAAAKLLVDMHFRTVDQPVGVVGVYDPFWGPGYWRRGFYRPYYDPVPLRAEDALEHVYLRQLRVSINGSDGSKLYEVTVSNNSTVQATPQVMPALVQSAFTGFPGQSGVPREVELKLDVHDAPPTKVASDKN